MNGRFLHGCVVVVEVGDPVLPLPMRLKVCTKGMSITYISSLFYSSRYFCLLIFAGGGKSYSILAIKTRMAPASTAHQNGSRSIPLGCEQFYVKSSRQQIEYCTNLSHSRTKHGIFLSFFHVTIGVNSSGTCPSVLLAGRALSPQVAGSGHSNTRMFHVW